MQHIETVTVGSGGAASITFMAVGDIPSEYTDLVVKYSLRGTFSGTSINIGVRFNGVATSTYSSRTLGGDGSSPFSAATTTTEVRFNYGSAATATSNTFANGELYIPNYRSSVAKSLSGDSVTENNATTAIQAIVAGLWSGTDPITSITLFAVSGNLVEFSSASLYGILAGSDGTTVVS